MTESKKLNIPPIAFVIGAAVVMIVCFIVMSALKSDSNKDEMFSEPYERTTAHCTNKEISSTSSGTLYFLDITFTVKDRITGSDQPVSVRISETDPACDAIDQGSDIDVYYRLSNYNFCHPTFLYPDHTVMYIILWIIVIICGAVAAMNILTIIRNKDGYTPKFEKPEDIGTLGDSGADPGLSDSKIDYSAGDALSDKLMDSYVDPFATYTGYEEENNAQQGSYYDPNAMYGEPVSEGSPNSGMDDQSLNDPYAASFSSDPSAPYNQGSFETPPSMFGENSNYNSAEIYGDSSFGQSVDPNSSEIYGNSSFGADKSGS